MRKDIKFWVFIITGILLVGTCVCFVQAKMESDIYNHLTGAHTTWWDALWVELRVMDTPVREKDKP